MGISWLTSLNLIRSHKAQKDLGMGFISGHNCVTVASVWFLGPLHLCSKVNTPRLLSRFVHLGSEVTVCYLGSPIQVRGLGAGEHCQDVPLHGERTVPRAPALAGGVKTSCRSS